MPNGVGDGIGLATEILALGVVISTYARRNSTLYTIQCPKGSSTSKIHILNWETSMPPKPPPPAPPPPPAKPPQASSPAPVAHDFKVQKGITLTTHKTVIYGPGGIGKSELCALLAKVGIRPFFFDLDMETEHLDVDRVPIESWDEPSQLTGYSSITKCRSNLKKKCANEIPRS